MLNLMALEMMKQHMQQVERAAERARLVREARPRRRHGDATGR